MFDDLIYDKEKTHEENIKSVYGYVPERQQELELDSEYEYLSYDPIPPDNFTSPDYYSI